jgi:hypothetical protein
MPGVACLLLELAAATAWPISRSGGVHNNQRVQRPGSKRSRLPRLRRRSGLGVGGPQRTATTEHASDQGSLNPGTEHEAFAQPAAAPAGAVGHFQSLVREFEDGQDSEEEVNQQVRGLVFKCEASGCRTLLPNSAVRWV